MELVALLARSSQWLFTSKDLAFYSSDLFEVDPTPQLQWDFDPRNAIRQRETVTYAENPFRLFLGLDVE